jgi:peroxiredoxin
MASYEAARDRFARLDTHVLGISTDPVPSKAAWARHLGGFWFDLLSDFHPHGAVAAAYGVLQPDGFSERAVFVVDRDGRVAFARRYPIGEQPDVEEVFRVLEQLP